MCIFWYSLIQIFLNGVSSQVGLGNNVAVASVLVPTEVILWKGTSRTAHSKCLSVAAGKSFAPLPKIRKLTGTWLSGGDLTSFIVERDDSAAATSYDLLMCGNGQWGGLGNNMFTNVQPSPLRARSISGLTECSCHPSSNRIFY